MLEVQCACGTVYRIPEEQSGRRARCKACNAVMMIPRVVPTAAPPPPLPLREESPVAVQVDKGYAPRRTRPDEDDRPRPRGKRKVQTVEQTGKNWKAIQLLSVLGILGTATAWFAGVRDPVVTLIALASILGYIVGRVGGWWFHG